MSGPRHIRYYHAAPAQGHMPFPGHRLVSELTLREGGFAKRGEKIKIDLRNAPSSMELLAASWKSASC